MMKFTVKTIGDLNKSFKNEDFVNGLTKEALEGFKKDLSSKECKAYVIGLSEKTADKVTVQIDNITEAIETQLKVLDILDPKASKKRIKKNDKNDKNQQGNNKPEDKKNPQNKKNQQQDKKNDKKAVNETKDLYKVNSELIFIEEDKDGNEVAVITTVVSVRSNDTDTYVTLENNNNIMEAFKFRLVKRRKGIRLQDLRNKSTFEIISKEELSEIQE